MYGSDLYTRYPIVARRAWPTGCIVQPLGRVRRASKGILHTSCIQYTLSLRRAWPTGCFVQPLGRVRARAKVSCIQAYKALTDLNNNPNPNDEFDLLPYMVCHVTYAICSFCLLLVLPHAVGAAAREVRGV